jgi:hypothetical protein
LRQRCDVKLITPDGPLFIEGKLLRLKGDNGKPNDNMLMHILSPYPRHRSALTDCAKLASSGIADARAVVIIGYTYDDMRLEPAISAFETLASGKLGSRCGTNGIVGSAGQMAGNQRRPCWQPGLRCSTACGRQQFDDVGRRQQRTEWGVEDRWRRLRSGSLAETDMGSRPGPPAAII